MKSGSPSEGSRWIASALPCLGTELGEDSRGEPGGEAEPAQALRPLHYVGLEATVAGARVVEQEVAQQTHVAQGDRETLADDRVVVTGRVPHQYQAGRGRPIGPGVLVRIGGAGTGDARTRQRRARRHRVEPERLEEALGSAGPGQSPALLQREAQVEAHAPLALREHQEVTVCLGADGLQLVGPAVGPVHQQPRHQVVGRVGVELDPSLTPDL
jgi:hypothetical protein